MAASRTNPAAAPAATPDSGCSTGMPPGSIPPRLAGVACFRLIRTLERRRHILQNGWAGMHHFAVRLRHGRWIAFRCQPERDHHICPAAQHQRGLPGATPSEANSRKYSTCRNFAFPSPNSPGMQQPPIGVQHPPARVPYSCSGKACNSIFITMLPAQSFPSVETRAIFCASDRECLSCSGLYSNDCCGHRSATIPIGVRLPAPSATGATH